MTEEEIHQICEQYNIDNYTVNSDMTVTVEGMVHLSRTAIHEIPLNFDVVESHFACNENHITSLKGCPSKVGKIFSCNENDLSSLKWCPQYVGADFWCENNFLTTLGDLPVNFYVGGGFFCRHNHIKEAKDFGKLLFGHVGGKIYTGYEQINNFLNENKNPPKKDLPRLLSELRKIQL